MQRDVGEGLIAYVLKLPRTAERPTHLSIFEPASRDAIGTVSDQEAFARIWMEARLEQ
jgi:hypothetical protein